MSLTLILGWWLIPTAITLYVFWRAARYAKNHGPRSDYNFGLDVLIGYGVAFIIALVAWFIYVVVRLVNSS